MNNLKERIDVHSHYFPPAYNGMLARRNITLLDGGIPKPDWSIEQQLHAMEKLNISHSVLSISSPHLHMGDSQEAVETARSCNEYGARLMKEYPQKIGVLGSLPLPEIEASISEIIYCRDVLKLNGFALQTNSLGVYLGSQELDPVMDELNTSHAVVAIHPTKPSLVPEHVNENVPYPFMEFFFDTTRAVTHMIMNGTIRKYPNIRFLIPHAGAFLPILSDRLEALSVIFKDQEAVTVKEDLASLYYDLCGMAMPKQYGVLRKITDDTHILYGSDGTFTPLSTCVRLAEEMDEAMNNQMATLVYRKNPLALFPNAQ